MTDHARFTDAIDRKVRVVAASFVEDRSSMTREDREDIEQEARMSCWKWLQANPEGNLGPGLVRLLTVQAARDYERSSRRSREDESLPTYHDESVPASQEYETVLGDILGRIVNDEREAAVAMLIVYEGLTVREAADHLRIDKMTVQGVMARLRDRAVALGVTS